MTAGPTRPFGSDYDRLIPPEVKDDPFYAAILRLARTAPVKTVLEIGSSSGEGSTEAFVRGLRENPHRPTLYCMEVSRPRFEALRNRYAGEGLVKAYNVSSVSLERFPSEAEATAFYNAHLSGRFVPLAEFLRWLRQDLEYIRSSNAPQDGIRLIKREQGIEHFDMVLIDGSEFTGKAELQDVYGARWILLDDINSFKNWETFERLSRDPRYLLREADRGVRGGYAVFEMVYRADPSPAWQEGPLRRLAVQRVRPGMTVIDVGGGDSTILFSRLVEDAGRVIALGEGDPERLRQRLAEHQCDNVEVVEATPRLDDVCRERGVHTVHVLRLGSGGRRVLEGAADLLARKAVRIVQFDERPAADVVELLKGHGYVVQPSPQGPVVAFPPDSVHFFTIVLNGEPFVRHHVEQLKRLSFDWRWHVIEGVAELKHDTAWSVAAGGKIPQQLHGDGRSIDGTSEYLDQLAAEYPGRVIVHRKPPGQLWDGKREMVSAPLNLIAEDAILWEVDVDELWTADQLEAGRRLFVENPTKTAAMYWCWYFVGPGLVISTRHCYANNPQIEWLRTWRYRPGMRWLAHEPPILGEPTADGRWRPVQAVDPLLHDATEAAGLVFQHYAYATEEQVRFKQDYYGYKGAVDAWRRLQAVKTFPVYLRDYFPWVRDDTQVDRWENYVERRLIELPKPPVARVGLPADAPRPRVIVDGVFFQLYRTGIARVWTQILRQWVKDGFARHVLVLDRAGTMPRIDGVNYLVVPPHDYGSIEADRRMLQGVCGEQGADVFVSTYCTTPLTTPAVFMAHDMIPELFGWDLNHPMWREKHEAIRYASAIVAVSDATRRDLLKFVPAVKADRVTVAPLGVAEELRPRPKLEVEALRKATGMAKPYFLLVGARGGYKNTILTFRGLAAMGAELDSFDVLCAGHIGMEEEFARLIPRKAVKSFHLTDDELAAAYSGALALLHPSTYEGFGLPVLEALACGCPVITTRNGSLAEVAGEAALFVRPDDVDGMVQAMREVRRPEVRERLIAAGLEQAKKFSWERTAATVRGVLEEVARASRP